MKLRAKLWLPVGTKRKTPCWMSRAAFLSWSCRAYRCPPGDRSLPREKRWVNSRCSLRAKPVRLYHPPAPSDRPARDDIMLIVLQASARLRLFDLSCSYATTLCMWTLYRHLTPSRTHLHPRQSHASERPKLWEPPVSPRSMQARSLIHTGGPISKSHALEDERVHRMPYSRETYASLIPQASAPVLREPRT